MAPYGQYGSRYTKSGLFYQSMLKSQYRKQIEEQIYNRLVLSGSSADQASVTAKRFAQGLNIKKIPQPGRGRVDISQMVSFGSEDITQTGDAFYQEMIQRATKIKGLGQDSGLSSDIIEQALADANMRMKDSAFFQSVNAAINAKWNRFYNEDILNHTQGILKTSKPSYEDFSGDLSTPQLDYLRRKSAQVLGITLREEGRSVSNTAISRQLARNGIDPNNAAQLRAFLINNKEMRTPSLFGQYNVLGFRPVSYDEAENRGFFQYLPERQQQILRHLNRRMAQEDPVSSSIGYLNVPGLYASSSGQMLDLTKVGNVARSFTRFITNEFEVPIIHLSPRSLFGLSQLDEMGKRSPISFAPGDSIQPFLPKGTPPVDFYIYQSKDSFFRRSKGTVTAYSTGELGERITSTLPGYYRPFNNLSQGFLTTQARYASGLINPERSTSGLTEPLSVGQRIKSFFDVAEDQPNSIFRLAGRFARRGRDIDNPTVISDLMEQFARGGPSDSSRLILERNQIPGSAEVQFRITDRAGRQIYNHEQFIQSAQRFFEGVNRYGFSSKVMDKIQEQFPQIGSMAAFNERAGQGSIKNVSRIKTIEEALRFAQELKRYDSGIDRTRLPDSIKSGFSRIEQMLQQGDLLAQNLSSKSSPSLQNRLDNLKSELYKYLLQRNAALQGREPGSPIQELADALVALRTSKKISANELIEAQGAALSALYNAQSFKNYSARSTVLENATAAVSSTLEAFGSTNLKALLTPFSNARNSQLHTSLRSPFSLAVPAMTKAFGTAKYQPIDTTNPLGANRADMFVPTFGSVFARNPFGAISSALGITGYTDPESFSSVSAISGHLVERLNRNIGTFGASLDPAGYSGSFDLFARGLVAKRALPLVAGVSTFMAADRTIGGLSQPRDANDQRVYSPFFTGMAATGVMELQSIASGIMPGGMSYQEKRDQLTEGEIPVRQGRYWPLGNTPFLGGKVQYYRPSWYRKFQAGALFTSDTYGSPMEKALFYNDYSPLRPFDPYRFERKHYYDRPYPLTGEYFTGPFGQLVPMLNSTVGRVLKPQVTMHEEQLQAGLSNYVRAGESGAYDMSGYLLTPKGMQAFGKTYPYLMTGQGTSPGSIPQSNVSTSGQTVPSLNPIYTGGQIGGAGPAQGALAYGSIRTGNPSSIITTSILSNENSRTAAMAQNPLYTARQDVSSRIYDINTRLSNSAYGPPKLSGAVPPRIVPAGEPINQGGFQFQSSEVLYRTQEMAGIYGFTFSSLREKFGFGGGDFSPQRSVLQSASKAYGSTRAFYDLNLGGMGDVPLPGEGPIGNLEVSEIVRRFIPKERNDVDYINPIQNRMGQQYPFLPGADYFINFKTGDPYTKIPDGEIRLPGIGYERLNRVQSDRTGRYGLATQFSILGDVAPYSPEFRSMNRMMSYAVNDPTERAMVQETREQVESVTTRNQFTPYKYKYASREETGMGAVPYTLARAGEYIAHRDTLFNTKFMQSRTAVEDYERSDVYGSSFSEWQRPFESFINPILAKATQRDPITSASVVGLAGSLFGVTPRAKFVGTAVGTVAGAAAGTYGNIYEKTTGERFIPIERKKQMALEEYTDILTYVKNMSMYSKAMQAGDTNTASRFKMAAGRTMYGADVYGASVENLSLAIPKRKREHFKAMIGAPEEERERILSTAPRLERRIYQAAWGMPVEKKPDLVDYFTRHELPDASWEGWHPNTNMEHVKVKIGQSMGIEMSQMGYYPQQIKEANLTNPSYPSFGVTSNEDTTTEKLRRLMLQMGINGSVSPVMTPFGGNSIDVFAGVR